MDPQHTGDLFNHLDKQSELLKEAHKNMLQELQKLEVEEKMMMGKLYELMVTHRLKRKGRKSKMCARQKKPLKL